MPRSYFSQNAYLKIDTLGGFRMWRAETEIPAAAWGREKALHLFQFFVTTRQHRLHKEQIIDRLWPELNLEAGDRDFKVALNTIYKVIEPERPPRAPSRFIQRFDLAYSLVMDEIWLDAQAFEAQVIAGNHALPEDPQVANSHYREAVNLYLGEYLPERRYEDWTSAERERLSTLALGTMTTLAGLLVNGNPMESLRLTQAVLATEPLWEQAYRIQMRAYLAQGNRPLALRTYGQCVAALMDGFNIEPLPETQALYQTILAGTDI